MRHVARPLLSILLCTGLLLAGAALAHEDRPLRLETVLPTLPGQNNVRWWEFDWRWSDFNPIPTGAPVRLFFYESEKGVAEVARPFIASAYEEYAERFGYTPSQQIPFLLYNSHFEFQSTQAFFVSEGVLGVTSTEDLTMALPYWGDHQRFQHVMRHELAHQFTIQKLVDEGRAARGCNPLQAMPLWFIEGIAERFSLPELTPEVRGVLADRLLAHGQEKPRGLPDFFAEGPLDFDRVYLMGHAQVRFLDEAFGPDTVRRVLDRAPELCAAVPTSTFQAPASPAAFEAFLSGVLGTSSQALDQQWKEWAREQVQTAFTASQPLDSLEIIEDIGVGDIDSYSLSPDGRVLFYRTVDRDSGVARLYLRDLSGRGSPQLVTHDQRIGLPSLHPLDRRVTAIGDDLIAYIGRKGDSDVLFVRRYRRKSSGDGFHLEGTREHDLSKFNGLIEGGHPAISPTGAVAFVGLKLGEGFLDVYRIDRPLEPNASAEKLTDDPYSERGLMYDRDGALYFVSDATPDGSSELFRMASAAVALTRFGGDVDVGEPWPDGAGGVFLEAGATGFLQAYHWTPGGVVRLSDVPTSLANPAVTADGALLGLALVDERRRLVRLPRERWLAEPVDALPAAPAEGGGAGLTAWSVPRETLGDVQKYKPLSQGNFRLEGIAAAAAGGPFIYGQAVFSDRLRTRHLLINAEVYGEFDRINADVFYVDSSGRTTRGVGLIAHTGLQVESDYFITGRSYYLQRLGPAGLVEYPLGQYMRLEGFVSPQVVRAFDFIDPERPFARENSGFFPGLQVGTRFALDTLRLSAVGPYAGFAFTTSIDGTALIGGTDPFGMASIDIQAFQNILTGNERLFVRGRIGAGTALGGAFREQFYLPAAENLRTLRPDSLRLLGEHYYLGQLELNFPLAPPVLGGIFLQGVTGVDVGAVAFNEGELFDETRLAPVVGSNLILGPITLRLHFSRPFTVQGGLRAESWITYFSIGLPFLFGPTGFSRVRAPR